jgi:hypothetical protein
VSVTRHANAKKIFEGDTIMNTTFATQGAGSFATQGGGAFATQGGGAL